MASTARSLKNKRVLVTDVENEYGKELQEALIAEGATVFTFVGECVLLQQVMKDFPNVIPVILNLNAKDGVDEGRKLLMNFPLLDYVVNLSGDAGLDIISKAYSNWKIQDFGESKVKPLITKMKDSQGKGLIFHSSLGNQNLMSKLKANLNPRFTDSATAQVTTSFKKSFKRFFSTDSSTTLDNSGPSSLSKPEKSKLSQAVEESQAKASEFHSLAASLSQSAGGGKSSPTNDPESSGTKRTQSVQASGNPNSSTNNTKFLSDNEKNEKIRQSMLKLNTKTNKKWSKLVKEVEKQCTSELRRLDKEINSMKKKEKALLMGQIAEANASTTSRSGALSAETTNQILASREARVDREVEKKAEKRRDDETQRISQTKTNLLETGTSKLYHKTIAKQIAEFSRLKNKYLV